MSKRRQLSVQRSNLLVLKFFLLTIEYQFDILFILFYVVTMRFKFLEEHVDGIVTYLMKRCHESRVSLLESIHTTRGAIQKVVRQHGTRPIVEITEIMAEGFIKGNES